MNDLTIISKDGAAVIDSREVAAWVEKNHKDLMRDIRGYVDCMSNERKIAPVDFFIESTYKDAKGEERPCYLVTRKGCEMAANKLTGQKGVLFTAAYIEKFHEYEARLAEPKLPRDYLTALKALVESEEEKKRLEEQAKADAPKVLFADSVAVADGAILIGELAKILKGNGVSVGQNRLFAWLRRDGFLIKRNGSDYNMPTQKAMEMGLFKVKETAITHSDGHVTVNKTAKVTGKGQQYFVNRYLDGANTKEEKAV